MTLIKSVLQPRVLTIPILASSVGYSSPSRNSRKVLALLSYKALESELDLRGRLSRDCMHQSKLCSQMSLRNSALFVVVPKGRLLVVHLAPRSIPASKRHCGAVSQEKKKEGRKKPRSALEAPYLTCHSFRFVKSSLLFCVYPLCLEYSGTSAQTQPIGRFQGTPCHFFA